MFLFDTPFESHGDGRRQSLACYIGYVRPEVASVGISNYGIQYTVLARKIVLDVSFVFLSSFG